MNRLADSPLNAVQLGLVALALVACGSESTPAISDHDQDGVQADDGDCDDFNNTVFPGATEVPGDGVDQDCDGADATLDDLDGDGVTVAQGDCDDRNNTVFPGARERSHDGVDSNCDEEDLPQVGDDLFAQALGLIDTDEDGAISFEEFDAACKEHAMLVGTAEPGVVNTHAACAGTNACRGMMLHPWGELFEHDCAGVNYCAGWSCTETAVDQGRDAATLLGETGCTNCHKGTEGAFLVQVPPGTDVPAALAEFPTRPDSRFRAAIAFGVGGLTPGAQGHQNMPGHFRVMSRAEMDTLVTWMKTATLEGTNFEWGDLQGPAKPE